MSEEETEVVEEVHEAESNDDAQVEQHEQVDNDQPEESEAQEQSVPLSALKAERSKRQEIEKQTRLLAEYVNELKARESTPKAEEEDPDDWVTNQKFAQTQNQTKQEIKEEVYLEMKPQVLPEINQYLDKIIEQKPWLADTIKSAPNRYARAYEIVQDYKHLIANQRRNSGTTDGQRISENMKKPRSPVAAKSANSSGAEYLRSVRGKPEFREYRAKVRRGEI